MYGLSQETDVPKEAIDIIVMDNKFVQFQLTVNETALTLSIVCAFGNGMVNLIKTESHHAGPFQKEPAPHHAGQTSVSLCSFNLKRNVKCAVLSLKYD